MTTHSALNFYVSVLNSYMEIIKLAIILSVTGVASITVKQLKDKKYWWVYKMFLILFLTFLFPQYEIGHYNSTFQDPDRSNRNIETEIYYPAITNGDNTTAVEDQFPVIIFGHGFVQDWDVYQNLWEEFVPNGYIMVFPRTEVSFFSTDHQQFGWDLQFLVSKIQDEGFSNTSPIYNAVDNSTALMGHSMGGGASFLAADSLCTNGNSQLKTLIGLAPAESSSNGVSSITSAVNVTVPSLILSGSQDGVTPPSVHHIPLYDSLASNFKTFISILGGAHCYFSNPSFTCDFGESASSTGISISREEQQAITYDFLNLWLDYTLKDDCTDFFEFQDSLNTLNGIDYSQTNTEVESCEEPVNGDINLDGNINVSDIVLIVNTILSNQAYNASYDLNNDEDINVTDIIILVNIILNWYNQTYTKACLFEVFSIFHLLILIILFKLNRAKRAQIIHKGF